MAGVRATVLIATRNRAENLDRCLTAIEQDMSCVDREIVVVDNGSTDRTGEVLAEHQVVALRWVQPGKSRALNLGVRAARGDFILFTDDDVIVHAGWAAALVAPFDDPLVGAVAGRVLPILPGPLDDWMRGPHLDHAALVDYGPVDRELSEYDLPFGANMAIRASLLKAMAEAFHVRLGHLGSGAMGWEEWHLLLGLRRTVRIAYAPDAVVEHHIDAKRLTWSAFRRNYFLGGMGFARHSRLEGTAEPALPRRLIRTARALRDAQRIRKANERRSAPTAEQAGREFNAYAGAGQHLETLLCGLPRITDWIAVRALRD
jgi:glycosyltransferase involved in cell wall biosynthesis